ncbi:MAG: hypothetical protein KAH44_09485, partial [Oricola sp.]|nr:hypothetical protein [Oricola sp.]
HGMVGADVEKDGAGQAHALQHIRKDVHPSGPSEFFPMLTVFAQAARIFGFCAYFSGLWEIAARLRSPYSQHQPRKKRREYNEHPAQGKHPRYARLRNY